MNAPAPRPDVRRARRIVVKFGSSILTKDGVLRPRRIADLARQVSQLYDDGREVVVVSSGAIALENNKDTHAHICRVYMNGKGVIEHAA